MGVILSKFKRAKPSLEDSLEKIDKEIHDIRRFEIDTELQQKQIIGRLTIIAFFIYVISILIYYLFIRTDSFTWTQHALSLLPFIVFPIAIWSLRRLFRWWYERKIVANKDKSKGLRKEKERLLDEVMEKETFKVAKKILEKYAPAQLIPKYLAEQQQRSLPNSPLTRAGLGSSSAADNLLRRRTTIGVPTLSQQGPRGPFINPQQFRPGFPPPGQYRPIMPAIMGPQGTPRMGPGPRPSMSSMPTGYTPQRFMLPPPPSTPVFHNKKTGWLDKLVDYVVGDGPAHRFALICRYCATHNGLATAEDFPFTGYRCIYCRQFNPPRQVRPSAATLPRNQVLIEELDSTRENETSTVSDSGEGGEVNEQEEKESDSATATLPEVETSEHERSSESGDGGGEGEREPLNDLSASVENLSVNNRDVSRMIDANESDSENENGDEASQELDTKEEISELNTMETVTNANEEGTSDNINIKEFDDSSNLRESEKT